MFLLNKNEVKKKRLWSYVSQKELGRDINVDCVLVLVSVLFNYLTFVVFQEILVNVISLSVLLLISQFLLWW